MIKSDWPRRAGDLLIGVAGSLLAAFILYIYRDIWSYPLALSALAFVLNLGLFLYYRYHYRSAASRLGTLQALTGLTRLDATLRDGDTPIKCMQRATSSLKFMGIGAQKWSSQEDELREMLSRMARVGGRARFLVLDPASLIAKETSVRSGHKGDWLGERITASLKQFKVLRDRGFNNIEVRLYSHYPYYRLVLLNDSVAIVGQYRGVDTTTGWEAPLVHFEHNGAWSFYQGYHVHFDGEWEIAKPVNWDLL